MTNKSQYYYGSVDILDPKGIVRTRRCVFAGIISSSKTEKDDKFSISIGYSECSEKDKFIKKRGREIALGRAFKKPIVIIHNVDKNDLNNTFISKCKLFIKEGIHKSLEI